VKVFDGHHGGERRESQLRAARTLERAAEFHDRTARVMVAEHNESSAESQREEATKCRDRAAEQRRLAAD